MLYHQIKLHRGSGILLRNASNSRHKLVLAKSSDAKTSRQLEYHTGMIIISYLQKLRASTIQIFQ